MNVLRNANSLNGIHPIKYSNRESWKSMGIEKKAPGTAEAPIPTLLKCPVRSVSTSSDSMSRLPSYDVVKTTWSVHVKAPC